MKCLLDLDGVLADFDSAIMAAHGFTADQFPHREWDYPLEEMGLSASQFWAPTNNADFWAYLDWVEDGQQILDVVLRHFDIEDVCILTSPTISPASAAGKLMWIQRHLPPKLHRNFLIGPVKEFCAGEGKILIDDNESNCFGFMEAGGDAILVPRIWNSLRAHSSMAPLFIEQGLRAASRQMPAMAGITKLVLP